MNGLYMTTPAELFFLKKAIDLIKQLGGHLIELRKSRATEINRIEKTFGNLDYLVPYYVVPDAQNVNPADFEEDDTEFILEAIHDSSGYVRQIAAGEFEKIEKACGNISND